MDISKSQDFLEKEQRVVEELLFSCINMGDREQLKTLLLNEEFADSILQTLLTKIYHNEDNAYFYDKKTILEATELLGESVKSLNMLHLCCMLGDEELALELLEFIQRITDEQGSKKPLLEFVGRVWGDGNTVLHLASFMGLDQLVVRLIELGANTNKKNDRSYRPVDCVADEVMCTAFNTLPLDGYSIRRISQETQESMRVVKSIDDLSTASNADVDDFDTHAGLSDSQRMISMIRRKRAKSVCAPDELRKRILSRPPSATSSFLDRLKTKSLNSKSVRFDEMSMILFICQHGEAEDDTNLTTLRKATEDKTIISRLETGHQNLTPLHLACAFNQITVVNFLLSECKVEVNSVDKEGWTPLHSACVEGHQEIVELLGRCQGRCGEEGALDADPSWFYVKDGPINLCPLNDDKETPEMLAVDKKYDTIVKIVQDLTKTYPAKNNTSLTVDIVSEDSTNDTGSDLELEEITIPLSNASLAIRILAPLKRHKSTSSPKQLPDRRKLPQIPRHETLSSSESSSIDGTLDVSALTTSTSTEHLTFPIDTNTTNLVDAAESLKAQKLSTSREFLKQAEIRIQNLVSRSKDLLHISPPSNSSLSAFTKADTLTEFKVTSNDDPAIIALPTINILLANNKKPLLKQSSSFCRDMEVVKMSGKYTNETPDHSTQSVFQSVDTIAPSRKFEAVKLPQTRVRAATMSPTRQNAFTSPGQVSAPNVFTAQQPKLSVEIKPTLPVQPFDISPITNPDESHSRKASLSVSSATKILATSPTQLSPYTTMSDIKRSILEAKSRIPTPVKPTPSSNPTTISQGQPSAESNEKKQSMLDRIKNFEQKQ